MKNIQIFILIGLIILAIGGYFVLIKDGSQTLQSSASSDPIVPLTPSPSPTPAVFKFDKSTDLKSELQTVNPKVEDNDFESLNKIISAI